jgi:RNA polymerase-binding transcription factor DksA
VDADTPAPGPGLDLDAVTADLVAVEAALERLDAGTYGRCLACDAPIGDEALAAAPTQLTCAAHLPV